MSFRPTRRSVTAGLALGALASPGFGILSARAQEKSVKMAMIAPLSGPWARQGQLLRQGADMAIDEINQSGGIKSLGGAKFELVLGRCRRQHREGQERGAAASWPSSPT